MQVDIQRDDSRSSLTVGTSESNVASGSQGGEIPSDMYMTPSELANVLLEAFNTMLSECESYVHYMEQRFRMEEDHLRQVKIMLERQRDLDMRINSKLAVLPGLLPDPGRLSNLRNTWGDIRLSEMWAVDLRLNLLMECRRHVLQPISLYRDAQERIRRRVKDDLKLCVDDYNEMLNVTLPRIRRNYERRCEEHEFYRNQQRAMEESRQLLSSGTVASMGGADRALPETPERNLGGNDSAVATPPLDAGAGKSSFFETFRKRDAWDQAPKRLNALFSRMFDGSDRSPGFEHNISQTVSHTASTSSHETPLPSPEPVTSSVSNKALQSLAIKQAKARREMDESDQAYRKAIFDLETLRIRRNKALDAAVKSLLEWRHELSITMQKVTLEHVRRTMAMRSSIEAVHEQDEQLALHMLDNFEEEQRVCEKWMPSTRTLIQNERVKYVNYFHGPFNDLIFGTGLVDYAFSHGDFNTPSTMTDGGLIMPNVRPPLIVSKCIEFLEQPRCIRTPGLYRVSAKHSRIQQITSLIEQDESSFQFDMEREDPVLVSSILKLYLRQLPEPVMALRWEERIRYTHEREEHIKNGFSNFKSRIRRMPPIHQATLRVLLMHLSYVASYSEENKMNITNLAVVFSPVILSEKTQQTTSLVSAAEEDCTLADLITYCAHIFAMPSFYAHPLPSLPPKPPLLSQTSTRAYQSTGDTGAEAEADVHSSGTSSTHSSLDVNHGF